MKSEKDLINGLEILKYEEEMLNATFDELAKMSLHKTYKVMDSTGVAFEYPHSYFRCCSQHIHDAILESFLLHIRILIEFLYFDKSKSKYDDDIVAQDYFDTPTKWHEILGKKSVEFQNTKDDLDKRLAHISLKRKESDKSWDCRALYQSIASGLKLFHDKKMR